MKTKKFLLTGAAAFVAAAAFGMPVSAAENTEEGSTTVTYTNNSSINGDSGVWGVVVPTAYSFTDTNLTSTGTVELIGINGYTLAELNDSLAVQVKAKSENAYKVVDSASNEIEYNVAYGTTVVDKTTAVDGDSFTTDAVTELTKAAPKTSTTATLSKKGTVKGTYTDKITYKVSHTGDELK